MKTSSAADDRTRVNSARKSAVLIAALAIAAPGLICAKVTLNVKEGVRTIVSDGMPDHEIGKFPNDHNPNTATTKTYHFKMPADPKLAETTTALGMWPFGVAIDGVPFDPFAAEWWRHDPRSGWQFEPKAGYIDLGLDKSNAHVQPDGAYHYHGVPSILVKLTTQPVLIGYAADGFPMYGPYGYKDAKDNTSPVAKLKSSYRVKSGKRPANSPGGEYDGKFVQDYEYVAGLGDLDEANGRTGVTPEYPNGTYYYVVTDEFPYVPRIFKGMPDTSFLRKPPPFGFRGGPGGMRPGMRGMGPMADNGQPQPGMHGGTGTGSRRGNRMGPPPIDDDTQPMGPPPGMPGGQDNGKMVPPPIGDDGQSLGPPSINGKTSGTSSKRRPMRGGPKTGADGEMSAGPEGMGPGGPPRPDGEDSDYPRLSARMRHMPPPPHGDEEDDKDGMRPPPPDREDGDMPPPPPGDTMLNALFGSDSDEPPPPPARSSNRKKSSGKTSKPQYY